MLFTFPSGVFFYYFVFVNKFEFVIFNKEDLIDFLSIQVKSKLSVVFSEIISTPTRPK